uniref:NADH-ubiquinone oxidoreductase chain 6 n=1 Tax=Lype phaeopa TaxID=623209 RepID=A0A7D6WFI0_9NEOP|nr:NADH dehydrogenase subunit 6 [Lype phaeopa]
MNFFLIMMFILLNLTFMMTKHPLSLSLNLFFQLLNSCFLINLMINKSWFSYILFIMFIGGLMILFMYMCSISSNMKFNIKMNKFLIVFMLITLMMILLLKYYFYTFYNFNYQSISFNLLNNNNEELLIKLFNKSSLIITILTIHMLFFMLIFTSQMIKFFTGPLRKKY